MISNLVVRTVCSHRLDDLPGYGLGTEQLLGAADFERSREVTTQPYRGHIASYARPCSVTSPQGSGHRTPQPRCASIRSNGSDATTARTPG